MNISVVGLNHKTAPVETRERLSIRADELTDTLCRLRNSPFINEGLILSTCNRVEVYIVSKETERGIDAVRQFLYRQPSDLHPKSQPLGISKEVLDPCLYTYTGGDAIRHLFRVASGLDSMVVGEPQILGQVQDAFEQARVHQSTGMLLNKTFEKALSVAKRVRTETKIAQRAVSISYAAVELAKKIFSELDQKTVLLIGAGEMAELAARHFITHKVSAMMIANRHYDHAVALARQFGSTPILMEDCVLGMTQSDIVLCSTGAPHYVIHYEDVLKVIAARQNRPIFLVDISVPRNIDPKINTLDNVFLYDIDDLQLCVETNLQARKEEALKAEAILSEEVERFTQWVKSLDVIPMIVALKDRAEAIRQMEVEKVVGRMGAITPRERELLDGLTTAVVNKLLHDPLTALKEETYSSNGNLMLEATRKLFRLDKK